MRKCRGQMWKKFKKQKRIKAMKQNREGRSFGRGEKKTLN